MPHIIKPKYEGYWWCKTICPHWEQIGLNQEHPTRAGSNYCQNKCEYRCNRDSDEIVVCSYPNKV